MQSSVNWCEVFKLPYCSGFLRQGALVQEPLEYGRILTEEDFARIHELRHRKMVDTVMRKHGLKSAAKRERLLASAQDEADEAMAEQVWQLSNSCRPGNPAPRNKHAHTWQSLLNHEGGCLCVGFTHGSTGRF